ncbi:MAG: DUF4167 domain-containing protein [Rhizobiaceae bacterium]
MRQGQPQNRQRSRGRGNNNRNANNRNQLNRSMESNGPDVRIRGTASHIAEKYAQLANDAQTAGDTVSAQSYWQFAEHYNRLVAAAQAAQQQAREEQQAAREARNERSDSDGDGDDNRREDRGRGRNRGRNRGGNNDASADAGDSNPDTEAKDGETAAAATASDGVNGEGPQPVLQDPPAEVVLADKPSAGDEANESEASGKPKKPRRPRKPKEDPASAASDDVSGLPAFVTGAE